MGYGRPHRFSSHLLPALYAAILTSLLAAYIFCADLYVGALYAPDPGTMLAFIPAMLILGIPSALFGLFAVWPLTLIAAELVARLARNRSPRQVWTIWLTSGAVLGGPALFLYSFPLRLGQAMLGPLLLNGALLGIVCAALVRKFAGPQIDDTAIALDPESADDPI